MKISQKSENESEIFLFELFYRLKVETPETRNDSWNFSERNQNVRFLKEVAERFVYNFLLFSCCFFKLKIEKYLSSFLSKFSMKSTKYSF